VDSMVVSSPAEYFPTGIAISASRHRILPQPRELARGMPDPLPLETDCKTVKSQLDAGEKFLLLDCREPDEYQRVSIPGAVLLPMSELQQRVAELEPHRGGRIVVHCHHGGRSLRVTNWLRSQGYEQSQSMAGGIDQWAVEIDPSLPRY
jgi:rhodanese-related sulfurtransferase